MEHQNGRACMDTILKSTYGQDNGNVVARLETALVDNVTF